MEMSIVNLVGTSVDGTRVSLLPTLDGAVRPRAFRAVAGDALGGRGSGHVTGITAHEFAHQWWPNQMLAAEMQGYTVFVETLAQYSSHMVMKKLRGEDGSRVYMQYELDRYLRGRAWSKEEPPLARVLGEDHISYRKGSMAMFLLQKRLGEDADQEGERPEQPRNNRFHHGTLLDRGQTAIGWTRTFVMPRALRSVSSADCTCGSGCTAA